MLLNEFWFGFWEYWHCENFVLGLFEYFHDVYRKSLLVYVNLVLETWKNFVGMCMDIFVEMGKFCGYEILTCEKFCWICHVWFVENLCGYDFGYVRIYLCMSLWEFLSWSCRNFFSFRIAMEKFGSCV